MEKLKEYRLRLGLSLRKAATAIGGISHSTLANLETGRIDVGYKKYQKIKNFYEARIGADDNG